MVSTPLKNISQLGLLFPIYGKTKKCSKPPSSLDQQFSDTSHLPPSAWKSHPFFRCSLGTRVAQLYQWNQGLAAQCKRQLFPHWSHWRNVFFKNICLWEGKKGRIWVPKNWDFKLEESKQYHSFKIPAVPRVDGSNPSFFHSCWSLETLSFPISHGYINHRCSSKIGFCPPWFMVHSQFLHLSYGASRGSSSLLRTRAISCSKEAKSRTPILGWVNQKPWLWWFDGDLVVFNGV